MQIVEGGKDDTANILDLSSSPVSYLFRYVDLKEEQKKEPLTCEKKTAPTEPIESRKEMAICYPTSPTRPKKNLQTKTPLANTRKLRANGGEIPLQWGPSG